MQYKESDSTLSKRCLQGEWFNFPNAAKGPMVCIQNLKSNIFLFSLFCLVKIWYHIIDGNHAPRVVDWKIELLRVVSKRAYTLSKKVCRICEWQLKGDLRKSFK